MWQNSVCIVGSLYQTMMLAFVTTVVSFKLYPTVLRHRQSRHRSGLSYRQRSMCVTTRPRLARHPSRPSGAPTRCLHFHAPSSPRAYRSVPCARPRRKHRARENSLGPRVQWVRRLRSHGESSLRCPARQDRSIQKQCNLSAICSGVLSRSLRRLLSLHRARLRNRRWCYLVGRKNWSRCVKSARAPVRLQRLNSERHLRLQRPH